MVGLPPFQRAGANGGSPEGSRDTGSGVCLLIFYCHKRIMEYTAYVSHKCDHCNRLTNMISSQQLENINIVDIHRSRVPPGVHSVPSMVNAQGHLFVGRQCFDLVSRMRGSGILGLDSGGVFSFIDDAPHGQGQGHSTTFSFIGGGAESAPTPGQAPSMLDDLIAKRNAEVPQPIGRT